MYIRVVQFSLGSGKRAAAEVIADKIVPAIRAQHGCERCEFITDDATGDYGMVVLWASKEDADASYSVINPMLQTALGEAGAKGTSIRLFGVYEPGK